MMARARADRARRTKFRLTLGQRLLPVAGVLVAVVGVEVAGWLQGGPIDWGLALRFAVLTVGSYTVGSLIGSAGFGADLTPEVIDVRNLRRRTIPWRRIQQIRVEPFLFTRTVVLYEYSGRRTRLRAPTTGFLSWDTHFEEKFHIVGRYWTEANAPDSVQDAAPTP